MDFYYKHYEQTATRTWPIIPSLGLIHIGFLCLILSVFSNNIMAAPAHVLNEKGKMESMAVDAGSDQNICLGETAQLEATGASSYQWSPSTGLSCTNCPNPMANPTTTTVYYVTGNDGTVDSVQVAVFSPPTIQEVLSTNASECGLDNGTILIDASGDVQLEYSITGGATWQGTGLFTSLAAGAYSVVVRNVGGACPVNGGTVTIAAPTAPTIIEVNSTAPSACNTPDGSITIVAQNGSAPLQYSIDGGLTWQSQNQFQSLTSGVYRIHVRNQDGSCIVSEPDFFLDSPGDEAIITEIFLGHPTNCHLINGAITVVVQNPGTNQFEFSIDGGSTYQLSNEFNGLAEDWYHFVVRNTIDGCLSDGGLVELRSFNHPVIYGTSVIQPLHCGAPEGQVAVLAFGPSSLEFSLDGGLTWQSSNLFTGLLPGTYQVAVQNNDGTCFTAGDSIVLAGPPPPTITAVGVNAPGSCQQNNGQITVAANGDGNLEYSINGGNTWTPNPTFSGLANGYYNIVVRYAGGFCEVGYGMNPVLLASADNPPIISAVSVSYAPECGVNNGQITIQANGVGSLLYSINGGLFFQSNPSFNHLPANDYTVVVLAANSGCTTSASSMVMATPGCPDTVEVTVPLSGMSTYCLEQGILDVQGTLTSAAICEAGDAATVMATGLTGTCVNLMAANGFIGPSPDLICLVHCFDNNPGLCDTTYLSITVEQVVCGSVFPFDSVDVIYAGNPTDYCVPVPYYTLAGTNLIFEGLFVNDPFGCEFEPTVAYDYTLLPGGGAAGLYYLEYWKVNGVDLTGTFADANGLLALMNTLDPAGNWDVNSAEALFFGGNPVSIYGEMKITSLSGASAVINPEYIFLPTGFTVGLSHLGLHVLTVTDPANGCSDTLNIFAVAPPSVTETVYETINLNSHTDEFCMTGAELPGNAIVSFGFCQMPANGVAPISNDSCVFYIPNLNFAGIDTFCVVACDGSFPQFCDTTSFIVNVLPEVNEVEIFIPLGASSIDTCLSNFTIQLPGVITSSSFCNLNDDEIDIHITDSCLAINPVNNFTGTSEACVIFCSGSVCDTTLLSVTVESPVTCDDILPQNPVTVVSPEEFGYFCFDVPTTQINGYAVTLDGQPYTQSYTPCNFGNITFYLYSLLPPGPYTLNSWVINSNVFSGNVADIQALVDLMNTWDPTGDWVIDVNTQSIQGGDPQNNYGNLVITPSGGTLQILAPDEIILPLGSQMVIMGSGNHELIVTAPDGCSDTTTIVLEQQAVTTDTLVFGTALNTTIGAICGNTDQLLGQPSPLNFCSLPSNGAVIMVGDSCVSYTPGLNFTGNDEFCFVICDDHLPQVCDTFVVVVTTALPMDTVMVDAPGNAPFDVCLDATAVQLPGIIDTAISCGSGLGIDNLAFTGNCVTIDLVNNFTGTTQACVIHCTGDVPPVCDTTILIISNDAVSNPCDDIFDPDEITVVTNNDTGLICLPIPLTDIFVYNILLDGAAYTGTLAGCDFDSAHIYNYNNVFGQGNQGPYAVVWSANGNTFSATNVADMSDLVDLMNGWDPNGGWVLIPATLTIMGTAQSGSYGVLSITHIATGSSVNIGVTSNEIPQGTQIYFLGEGGHTVIVENPSDGCSDTLFINAIDEADVVEIVTVEDMTSTQECLDTAGLPGAIVSVGICSLPQNGSFDLTGNCFTYTPFPGFTGNDEGCLVVCDNLGNCDTTIVLISVVPFCSTFDLFPVQMVNLQAASCIETTPYCVGVLLDSIGNYAVLDNGFPYTGGFSTCNGNLVQINLDTGYHEVVFYHATTGCQDTLLAQVACSVDTSGCGIPAISPLELVALDCEEPVEFCVEVLLGDIQNFMVTANGSPYAGNYLACGPNGLHTAVELETGIHELIFTDTVKGCADTFNVEVLCYNIIDTTVLVEVPVGSDTVLCLEDYGFDINAIDSIVVGCLPLGNADFEIDETTWCITVFGSLVGLDTGCFKVYALDTCSNFNVNVEVVQPCPDFFPGDMMTASVHCQQDSGVLCLPLSVQDLQNKVFFVDNMPYDGLLVPCEFDSMMNPTAYGIQMEVGTHQLTLADTVLQCAQTVTATISCITTSVFFDTISISETATFCLDLTELNGVLVDVYNDCPGTGDIVEFNTSDSCVVYTGIDAGLDSACMVICDDLGVCDTTFIYITVLLTGDSMVSAVTDSIVTGEGQVIAIDVLQNDTIFSLDDFYIVDPPLHGMAVFLPNGSVNYVPDPDYCDDAVPDSFTYAICNELNCDTATVYVTVSCSGFEVFNAFSPNGDGQNDFFKITGLQFYPGHQLYVYNRWGNLVFEATNYQSTWNGTWDGNDLPDGTYYYVLDLGDGTKPESGYVQLNR